MVSKVVSQSFEQQTNKGGSSNQGRPEVSASWMVLVASMILAWISLMPIGWIGYLMFERAMRSEMVMLIICGLAAFGWNLFHLRWLLCDLYHPDKPGMEEGKCGLQAARVFGVQFLLAIACTHASGEVNPIGMQQWFWMPTAGFAGVLLTRRLHMVVVLCFMLAVSSAREYVVQGVYPALYWACGQLTTSVFIMGCCFVMTQASRQRKNTARVAAELRSANAQLELRADQAAVVAVEQERNRLAREIHDAVGHSLTVVVVQLEAAQALLHESPARALDSIQKAQRSSREGLAEIRRSVSSLRATPQDERTLAESLTSLITGAERPGLKLVLQQSGKSRPLPSLVEISLYRCAQEGITNACRHAGASEITVHLDFTSDTSVALSVADNGRGFSAIPENGHGLKGLRERAVLLNGSFFAGSEQRGGGFCRMVVPG